MHAAPAAPERIVKPSLPGSASPPWWRHPTAVIAGGVALLVLLMAAFTMPRTVRAIELDIGARAAAATARHDGEVRSDVRHQTVTLRGVVPNAETRERLVRDVAGLRGVLDVQDQLTVAALPAQAAPDEYLFDAVKNDGRVVLSGYVPNDTQRASLVGLARVTFAPTRVVDRLALAPDPPAEFDAAIKFGMQQLAALDSGALRFNGRRALLDGVVDTAEQRRAIELAVADHPQAPVLRLRYDATEQARRSACQAAMTDALAAAELRFATGSDVLRAGAESGLDEMAAVIQRCTGLSVRVEGHTDSAGVPQQNLSLSSRRARAVADELIARGVAADRLHAEGFGDRRPIGDNATRAGRAANRRIELVVVD